MRRAMRSLCRPVLHHVPPAQHAVVHGWPDDEGNAVEVVRALRRRYKGKVYWLLADVRCPSPAYAASELDDASRVTRVPKNSVRAVLLALTAEVTFFTHGLFTAVDPPKDRLVVNLWHGDGPKVILDTDRIRSTVLVAATELWAECRAREFGMPTSAVAVVGNPRVDQFAVAPPAAVLSSLRLDPSRRTILWLPTYRVGEGPNSQRWSDADSLSESSEVLNFAEAVSRAVKDRSLQVIVKPHPLDTDVYETLGLPVIRNEHLMHAGVTFYQLLGSADAIISDVSSVWVDFLTLDRPIGFYVPDLDELQHRRGVNVDNVTALFPGPQLVTPEDVRRFLETVVSDPDRLRPSRYPGFSRIGVVTGDQVTDRLLDWLDDFQRFRGQPVLFRNEATRVDSRQLLLHDQ